MSKVTRENGTVEDSEVSGNTVITVTITGIQPTNDDMLDRFLQFVMMELGVDTQWQTRVPTPMEVPPPPDLSVPTS